MEDHVPSDALLRIAARQRTLAWRETRLSSTEKIVLDDGLTAWLLFASFGLVAVAPWLGGYLGDAGLWNIGRSVLALGVYTIYLWVIGSTAPPVVVGIGCTVVAVVSAWSLLPAESGFHLLLRSVVMAPAVVLLAVFGITLGTFYVSDQRWKRLNAAEAHAVLVRDLLKLLRTVERRSTVWQDDDLKQLATLIESIAHSQARVVRRVGTGDKTLASYAGHHALGVAAATRDLKQKLVTWDAQTPKQLFRRARRMLDATCRNEWGRFTYREPDRLRRQLRIRVWSIVRFGLMAGVVAFGVWLVLLSRQNPDAAAAPLTAITGLLAAIAPIVVPLVEYMTTHSERFDPRKAKVSEPARDGATRYKH